MKLSELQNFNLESCKEVGTVYEKELQTETNNSPKRHLVIKKIAEHFNISLTEANEWLSRYLQFEKIDLGK